MSVIFPRRRFLLGLAGLVAAPAIVRAASLMKVVAPPLELEPEIIVQIPYSPLGVELARITREAFLPSIYATIYERSPLFAILERNAVRQRLA